MGVAIRAPFENPGYGLVLLASERAQSCSCSIEISDTQRVR